MMNSLSQFHHNAVLGCDDDCCCCTAHDCVDAAEAFDCNAAGHFARWSIKTANKYCDAPNAAVADVVAAVASHRIVANS